MSLFRRRRKSRWERMTSRVSTVTKRPKRLTKPALRAASVAGGVVAASAVASSLRNGQE
jgi:hypothetical protein